MAMKKERKLIKARIPVDVYDGLKILSIRKKLSFQKIILNVVRNYVLDNLSVILTKDKE